MAVCRAYTFKTISVQFINIPAFILLVYTCRFFQDASLMTIFTVFKSIVSGLAELHYLNCIYYDLVTVREHW